MPAATHMHSPCLPMQIQRYNNKCLVSTCNAITVQVLRKKVSMSHSQPAGKWRKREIQKKLMLRYLSTSNELGDKNEEFPFVSFDDIVAATDNFSDCNMLGRGGFGKVYKVMANFHINSYRIICVKTIIKTEERIVLFIIFQFRRMQSCRECWKEGRKLLSKGLVKVLGRVLMNSETR